jgi:hypothetical protein
VAAAGGKWQQSASKWRHGKRMAISGEIMAQHRLRQRSGEKAWRRRGEQRRRHAAAGALSIILLAAWRMRGSGGGGAWPQRHGVIGSSGVAAWHRWRKNGNMNKQYLAAGGEENWRVAAALYERWRSTM